MKNLTKIKFWLLLPLFSIALNADAQDFCQEKDLSAVEKEVCDSYSLAYEMDFLIKKLYSSAIETTMDLEKYRAEHDSWVNSIRQNCQSAVCFKQAYTDKYIALLDEFMDKAMITGERFYSAEQYENLCSEIAEKAKHAELASLLVPGIRSRGYDTEIIRPQQWRMDHDTDLVIKEKMRLGSHNNLLQLYNLKLNEQEGLTPFARYREGGSCASSRLFNVPLIQNLALNSPYDNGIDPTPDPDEYIRWSYWGSDDYPIIYKQRNLVITGKIDDPKIVAWIMPSGRTRRLCTLEKLSNRRVVAVPSEKKLCQKITDGNILPTPWVSLQNATPVVRNPHTDRENFKKLFGFYADEVKTQIIDINNDGNTENIALFEHYYGHSCGRYEQWIREINTTADGLVEGALNQNLEKWSPLIRQNNRIDTFHYDGVNYVLYGNDLYQLNSDNQKNKICEIRDEGIYFIKALYK